MDQLINLICCLTGIMLFAYWLNYVMGTPLADDPKHVDPGAFLYYVPLGMARRRLAKIGKLQAIRAELKEDLSHSKDPMLRHQLRRDARRNIVVTARQLFDWERALLCPVCLHFWGTLIFVAIDLTFNYYHSYAHLGAVGLIYLVNHFIIRKI